MVLQLLLLPSFLSQLDFLGVLLALLDLHGESFGDQLGSDSLLSFGDLLDHLSPGLASLSSSEDSLLKVDGLLKESILLFFQEVNSGFFCALELLLDMAGVGLCRCLEHSLFQLFLKERWKASEVTLKIGELGLAENFHIHMIC